MHRWSKLFIPTLREAPADAEVASHKFLLRAGYIRQLGAGIYSYLFLGQRSINKIVAIVREEMDKIGQEFYLPGILPREPWEQSGRWTGMGDNMFRLKDRKGADLCLGMTHEEIMTTIARGELRSYKQLPQIWYQIQTKFRDEPRPKSGLLRVRQFIMKDSYSFDIDKAGLDKSFELHDAVYRRIFTRCGLRFVSVEADSGSMGGSQSQEFMVYTDAGEDLIASCPVCGYAANLEKATSRLEPVKELEPTANKPEEIHTPGMGAIADVAAFLKMSPANDIKCVAYIAIFIGPNGVAQIPIVVLLRGDHSVNEAKLGTLLSTNVLEFMDSDEILNTFVSEALNLVNKSAKGLYEIQVSKTLTSPAGYLGPVGIEPLDIENLRFLQEHGILPKSFSVFKEDKTIYGAETLYGTLSSKPSSFRVYYDRPVVILDSSLDGRKNMVCGANQLDYHLRNVTPGRDFTWTLSADIRSVNEGEACPQEGCTGRLAVGKAVEIGHIFKLGYKYSESMGARVLDENGKEVTPIMGSYGIGIERILTASIEQANDKNGFWLPAAIAPFTVVVTVTNASDAALAEVGEKLAAELEAAGLDVLLDDRDERAGVKFKDADLVGIPYRVNVGRKAAGGFIELQARATATSMDVAIQDVVASLKARVEEDALLTAVEA
ncbi:MAG: proline--tRNA ligase [Terracidiphilus sp.]|jgi:prolyl-tRNA synthetase